MKKQLGRCAAFWKSQEPRKVKRPQPIGKIPFVLHPKPAERSPFLSCNQQATDVADTVATAPNSQDAGAQNLNQPIASFSGTRDLNNFHWKLTGPMCKVQYTELRAVVDPVAGRLTLPEQTAGLLHSLLQD